MKAVLEGVNLYSVFFRYVLDQLCLLLGLIVYFMILQMLFKRVCGLPDGGQKIKDHIDRLKMETSHCNLLIEERKDQVKELGMSNFLSQCQRARR